MSASNNRKNILDPELNNIEVKITQVDRNKNYTERLSRVRNNITEATKKNKEN